MNFYCTQFVVCLSVRLSSFLIFFNPKEFSKFCTQKTCIPKKIFKMFKPGTIQTNTQKIFEKSPKIFQKIFGP